MTSLEEAEARSKTGITLTDVGSTSAEIVADINAEATIYALKWFVHLASFDPVPIVEPVYTSRTSKVWWGEDRGPNGGDAMVALKVPCCCCFFI